jgi:hypothetical protein
LRRRDVSGCRSGFQRADGPWRLLPSTPVPSLGHGGAFPARAGIGPSPNCSGTGEGRGPANGSTLLVQDLLAEAPEESDNRSPPRGVPRHDRGGPVDSRLGPIPGGHPSHAGRVPGVAPMGSSGQGPVLMGRPQCAILATEGGGRNLAGWWAFLLGICRGIQPNCLGAGQMEPLRELPGLIPSS